ncbi:Ig-like domain-containing protein [Streptomyces sp. CAU 1734]|uniref:L,D-transpeptidase n=1 Tax=Streptomyces sp. CAU 1734 TaxID=3140360 RepID=UPI00326086DF
MGNGQPAAGPPAGGTPGGPPDDIPGGTPAAPGPRRRTGRRAAVRPAGAAALLVLVTACGGAAGDRESGAGAGRPGAAASRAVVTIAPEDGAASVATSGALRVAADGGRLTEVTVEDDRGAEVAGRISADGGTWRPARHLAGATKYRVHAVARDENGRESAKTAGFTTLVPGNTFIGHHTPGDGATVGVGMPVSLSFTRGITAPEAVERAITVTSDPPVPVEGHWFGDDRLDFRPEKYWEPGTRVTVRLDLDGVEGRPGVRGTQTGTLSFTIGRSQISTVDARSKRMRVVRDGALLRELPVTAGAPATTTYNGTMVISEKYKVTRMNGPTVGFGGEYDIKDVPHAMRLSASGTFVHGNYWVPPSTFGAANAGHGGVGLRDVRGADDERTPAAWLFAHSLIGDVVVVKNSDERRVAPDNGLNGWNMSWAEWNR